MALPNLLAIFLLRKDIVEETKIYLKYLFTRKNGEALVGPDEDFEEDIFKGKQRK